MLAEIIPAARLPRSISTFSYRVPPQLAGQVKIGQLARFNLRHKNTIGLITSLKDEAGLKIKYQLKDLDSLVNPAPLVTAQQIELIEFISSYYYLSPALVLNSLLPQNFRQKKVEMAINEEIDSKQKRKHKSSISLLWYNTESEKIVFYQKIIKQNLDKKKQVLLLVPQISDIVYWRNNLHLSETEYVAVSSHMSATLTLQNWQKIISGAPVVITGTKIAVLQPFKNLGAIIVDNEQDWNLKQSDINPRFDARLLAEFVAQSHQAHLLLASPAPRLETYFKTQNKEIRLIIRSKKNGNRLVSVDLNAERLTGNYSIISEDLKTAVENTVKTGKKIFLFWNRRGLAQVVNCPDCHFVFKCPNCQISLNYHLENAQLLCHGCGFKEDLPPLCPKCGSPRLKFQVSGSQKIEQDLKKMFPNLKILRLDKDADASDLKDKIKNSALIIGTEFAIRRLDWADIKLVAVLSLDQLLNRADFRAQEKTFQLILKINSLLTKSEILIQSYQANQVLTTSLTKPDYEQFYQKELASRQLFSYPPYTQIIKLTYQNRNEKKAKLKAAELRKLLINELAGRGVTISASLPAYPKKVRRNFHYHLILKKPLQEKIRLDKLVPADWLIDVDPENLG